MGEQGNKPSTNKRKIALALSIIPGFGQFYNKQWLKGLIFLVLTVSFFVAFSDLLQFGFWGLVTLGSDPAYDHSDCPGCSKEYLPY